MPEKIRDTSKFQLGCFWVKAGKAVSRNLISQFFIFIR